LMTIDLFFLSFGLLCCHQRKGRKRESIAEQASLSDQSPGGIAFIGPGRLGAALPVGLLPKAAFTPILLPRSQRVAILYVRRLGSACSSSSKMHQLSLSLSLSKLYIHLVSFTRSTEKKTNPLVQSYVRMPATPCAPYTYMYSPTRNQQASVDST
jgi:hypothetical protein